MNASTTPRVFPIRFRKLNDGSKYQIFAEPSRDIRLSKDKTVYIKVCDAYSVDAEDPDRAIILYPEDLVVPLSRGKQA